MTSNEIRQSFLDFFKSKNHAIVQSAPVIPHGDPTLYFTNAGMNQFKGIFLGNEKPNSLRVVDTQKCIRVSGKHNDLEEVGRDTFHHTFFEMLGNWSFGDYYKKEAIMWAWELLTEVWGFPKERLWASVYKNDDEAFDFWKNFTDINPAHILRFGEKDNFWEMGETGPCGPCSEIHFDLSLDGNLDASKVNSGSPYLIEIWNLVFIQNNRKENGELEELPAKHVDTGMGFERVCSVMNTIKNGYKTFPSNYDTDVFTPIINSISKITNLKYGTNEEVDIAHRVIADHIRALAFAIADGALPSNEGRGYVLRRILRRASRFGRNLKMHEPFLYKIVSTLSSTMGDAFPELRAQQSHIEKIILGEEEGFNKTLDRGLEIFESTLKNIGKKNMFSGIEAFKLYDTFGFPLDLTQLLCSEKGLSVDEKEFENQMNLQKQKARNATGDKFQFSSIAIEIPENIQSNLQTKFCGYGDSFEIESTVSFANESLISLDKTPLYAESGGQISDFGNILFEDEILIVIDSKKIQNGIVHFLKNKNEKIKSGAKVIAKVDVERRKSIMRNHTATHLLHSALRNILGTHVHQAGSLVSFNHLRFDFAHYNKVTDEQIIEIENYVNEKILDSTKLVHHLELPIEDAKKMGAIMFFGDKYGEKVNVVQFGNYSIEFCGGTHISNTNEIGYFKIKTEGSSASGIRRIEALTNSDALEFLSLRNLTYREQIEHAYKTLDELETIFQQVAKNSNGTSPLVKDNVMLLDVELRKLEEIPTAPINIENKILQNEFDLQDSRFLALENFNLMLQEKKKIFLKELSKYTLSSTSVFLDKFIEDAIVHNGIKIVAQKINSTDANELKSFGDLLRQKLGSGVGLLASIIDEKVSLVCVVTDDLIASKNLNAGKIILEVSKIISGGGGGKAHLATAGGKDVSKIDDAILKFRSLF